MMSLLVSIILSQGKKFGAYLRKWYGNCGGILEEDEYHNTEWSDVLGNKNEQWAAACNDAPSNSMRFF